MKPETFSIRARLVALPTRMAADAMPDSLRIRLWNTLDNFFIYPYEEVTERYWRHFSNLPVDQRPRKTRLDDLKRPYQSYRKSWKIIRGEMMTDDWFRIYDRLEFFTRHFYTSAAGDLTQLLNEALEREFASYRIVNATVVPISGEVEIQTFANLLENSGPFAKSLSTLSQSLEQLSPKRGKAESPSIALALAVKAMREAQANVGHAFAKTPRARYQKDLEPVEAHLKGGLKLLEGYAKHLDTLRGYLHDSYAYREDDARFYILSAAALIGYWTSMHARLQNNNNTNLNGEKI